MSSFLGHALIGTALFARNHKLDTSRDVLSCLFVAGLAMSPDVDYLFRWFFNARPPLRYTHSLCFCLCVGLMAWGWTAVFCRQNFSPIPTRLLFFAPLSHLLLDFLVGVYPLPLGWPFYAKPFVLSFGVLPSAGKLSLTNYYLWRNLLIEMGILLPIVIAMIPRLRKWVFNNSVYRQGLVFTVFLYFLLTSVQLNR